MANPQNHMSEWNPVKYLIAFGFMMALGALGGGSFLSYLLVDDMANELRQAAQPDYQWQSLQEVIETISTAESGVRAYTITQDTGSLKAFYEAATGIDAKLDTLSVRNPNEELMDSLSSLVEEKFLLLKDIIQVIDSVGGSTAFDKLYARVKEVRNDTIYETYKTQKVVKDTITSEDEVEEEELTDRERKKMDREIQREEKRRKKKKNNKNNIFAKIFGGKKNQETSDSSSADTAQIELAEPVKVELDTIEIENVKRTVAVSGSSMEQIQALAKSYEAEEDEQMRFKAERILTLTFKDQAIMARLSKMFEEVEAYQLEQAQSRANQAQYKANRTTQVIATFIILIVGIFLVLLIIIFSDISRNRRLHNSLGVEKARAEKLAKAKEEFLSNMSHELRTPMNAVMGFTEQLNNTPLNEEQSKYLNIVSRSADHLLALLNDVLDYSKLESGKFQLEAMGFEPKKILQNAIETFGFSAEQKGLKLCLESSDSLPGVLIGDPLRLKQMIYNLLSNAIKFTEAGTVTLKAEAEIQDDKSYIVQLSVLDTGIGIAPEKQEKIFADFEQAETGTTRRFGGTGLGLSITRKLAELHGGRVGLESELGKGTEMFLWLPFLQGVREDLLEDPSFVSKTGNALRGLKALVADDEPYNRELVTIILNKWGLEVESVHNGLQALEKLESSAFDLVLMDLNMPELGGLEATKRLRNDLGLTIPVIALTATASPTEVSRCQKAGMDGHLLKPFHEGDLYGLLLDLLELEEEEQAGNLTPLKPVQDSETGNSKAYNLDALAHMGQQDSAFIQRMLILFVENGKRELQAMTEASTQENWSDVGMAAHKLIPACRHLGMTDIVDRLKIIELAVKETPLPSELPQLIQEIIKDLQQVIGSIESEKL